MWPTRQCFTFTFCRRMNTCSVTPVWFSTVKHNRLLSCSLLGSSSTGIGPVIPMSVLEEQCYTSVTFQRHTREPLIQNNTEHETCYGEVGGGMCDSPRRRRCLACLRENGRKLHKTSGIWDGPWETSSSKDEDGVKSDQNGGGAIHEGPASGNYESIKRKTAIQCGWNAW